jgi:hypothetical protein
VLTCLTAASTASCNVMFISTSVDAVQWAVSEAFTSQQCE